MPRPVGDAGSRRTRGTPGGQSQPGHAADLPVGSHHSRSRETFDVRFWKIRVYKGKRGRSYAVRWTVAGREFHQAYETSALAESRLAELRTFARDGVAFDTETGLPVPEVRSVRAQAAQADEVSWYQHAVRYVARRWDALSPNSRRSVAETLTTVMPVLLAPGKDRPSDAEVRQALYKWAFRNEPRPPEEVARVLAWVEEHSLPVSALADEDLMLDVLAAISRTLDGGRAAANTVARKRAVLSNVLDYAVGRGLEVNPLPKAAKMQPKPKSTEGVVDPQVVVNRRQAEELLTAVSYQGRIGPRLVAFFACLYFAGLRPSEAVELREQVNLDLPVGDDWGTLYLRGSAPTVGAGWSASGRRRDPRQLKHRAREEVRPVPCHPALTAYLHQHIEQFGTAPDGRLFRGERGGDLSESVYGRAWQGARLLAFPPALAASPLARRPYDLRHACLSTWLNGGVEATQVAAWAGNSVQVLLRVYAKCIADRDQINRRRIEEAFRDGRDPERR
jgi:integrase